MFWRLHIVRVTPQTNETNALEDSRTLLEIAVDHRTKRFCDTAQKETTERALGGSFAQSRDAEGPFSRGNSPGAPFRPPDLGSGPGLADPLAPNGGAAHSLRSAWPSYVGVAQTIVDAGQQQLGIVLVVCV